MTSTEAPQPEAPQPEPGKDATARNGSPDPSMRVDSLIADLQEKVARVSGNLDRSARIDALLREIKGKIANVGDDKKVQDELAALINLLPDIARSSTPHLIGVAEVAATALTSDRTSDNFATKLTSGLSRRIRFERFLGFSAPTATVLGLAIFFYLILLIAPFVLNAFLTNLGTGINDYLGTPLPVLFLIGSAGALGSIVSVMTRIDGSTFREGTAGPQAYILIGFFKPMVGAAFALFVFALLQSPIVPIDLPQPGPGEGANAEGFLYLALAFVAGFSERFASNLATRAEQSTAI